MRNNLVRVFELLWFNLANCLLLPPALGEDNAEKSCTGKSSAARQRCGTAPTSRTLDEVDVEQDLANGLVALTSQIVSAYVTNNPLAIDEIPALILHTHTALSRLSTVGAPLPRDDLRPKIAPKKSVLPDFIICLEDGKKFKSLKRHLRTHYNLAPEQYHLKWDLPHDYPMVAPN